MANLDNTSLIAAFGKSDLCSQQHSRLSNGCQQIPASLFSHLTWPTSGFFSLWPRSNTKTLFTSVFTKQSIFDDFNPQTEAVEQTVL
jgi:hypothetical protein